MAEEKRYKCAEPKHNKYKMLFREQKQSSLSKWYQIINISNSARTGNRIRGAIGSNALLIKWRIQQAAGIVSISTKS